MKFRISILLLSTLMLFSCSKDDNDSDDMDPCNTENVTYSNTVEDIFETNCTLSGCHSSGSVNGSLATYDDAVSFVSNKPILAALRREPGAQPMPRGFDKLPTCTIDQIEAWINDGTPE